MPQLDTVLVCLGQKQEDRLLFRETSALRSGPIGKNDTGPDWKKCQLC